MEKMQQVIEQTSGYMVSSKTELFYWGNSIHVARLIAHVMKLDVI